MMRRISVAKDFSPTPGARWRREGKYSGEAFREDVLTPTFVAAAEAGDTLLVDLDGVEGFASSFLEEAFGGLARLFPGRDLLQVLTFKSEEDPYRVAEIEEYIRDAAARAKAETA